MNRVARRLAVMAAVVLGTVAMAGLPAEAGATVDREARAAAPAASLWHDATGLCLDASVSQGVRLNSCNGGSYQQWTYTSGRAVLHSASGLCLDGSASQGVRLNTCNGGSYQRWWYYTDWTMENDATNLYLDASVSQGVRLNTFNGGAYQRWLW